MPRPSLAGGRLPRIDEPVGSGCDGARLQRRPRHRSTSLPDGSAESHRTPGRGAIPTGDDPEDAGQRGRHPRIAVRSERPDLLGLLRVPRLGGASSGSLGRHPGPAPTGEECGVRSDPNRSHSDGLPIRLCPESLIIPLETAFYVFGAVSGTDLGGEAVIR